MSGYGRGGGGYRGGGRGYVQPRGTSGYGYGGRTYRPRSQGPPPRTHTPRTVPAPQPPRTQPPLRSPPTHPYVEQLGISDKWPFSQVHRPLVDVCKRHRRNPPMDFVSMEARFAAPESAIRRELVEKKKMQVEIKETNQIVKKDVEEATSDGDREYAFVILFTGVNEDSASKIHLNRRISFVVGKHIKGGMHPFGGVYDPQQDGSADGLGHLKRAAVRHVKTQVGLDISECDGWQPFAEFNYNRADSTKARSVYFVIDCTNLDTIEPATLCIEEKRQVTEELEEKKEEGEGDQKKTIIVRQQITSMKAHNVPQSRPTPVNLNELLSYENRSHLVGRAQEEGFEFGITADVIDEMLQRDFGMELLEILKKKKAEADASKKRKREEEEEAAVKKAKLEAEKQAAEEAEVKKEDEDKKDEDKKDEDKKEEPKEEKKEKAVDSTATPPAPKKKTKTLQDEHILRIFHFFDRGGPGGQLQGYVRRHTLEGLLHSIGELSKGEVEDLLTAVNLRRANKPVSQQPVLYFNRVAAYEVEVEDEPEPEETHTEGDAGKDDNTTTDAKTEEEKVKTEGDTEMKDSDPNPTTEEAEAAADDAAKPTATEVKKWFVKELRTYCEKHGLSSEGAKAALQDRVLEHLGYN